MLQWIDNFQQYGTTAANLLNGAYAEANGCALVTDPDPTASGVVLKLAAGSDTVAPIWGNYIRKVLNAQTTMGVSVRVWMSHLPTNGYDYDMPIVFTDTNNAALVTLKITPTGTIQAFRGDGQGTLLGESSVCIVANAWQRIEAKVLIDGSAGTVSVKVENVSVLNLTGQNTKPGSTTTIANWLAGAADSALGGEPTMYLKDLACWDTTGSLNNDFLGSCFVTSMRPDSDVSGSWTITGGAGSAFASINGSSPDDDTTYISSPWPAATQDICTLSDLPASATRVLGMMALVRSRKSDGGDGNLQVSMVSGASTGNGANRAITTAYTYWSDIFETDPATSAAWTVSAANASKIQFNRTL